MSLLLSVSPKITGKELRGIAVRPPNWNDKVAKLTHCNALRFALKIANTTLPGPILFTAGLRNINTISQFNYS